MKLGKLYKRGLLPSNTTSGYKILTISLLLICWSLCVMEKPFKNLMDENVLAYWSSRGSSGPRKDVYFDERSMTFIHDDLLYLLAANCCCPGAFCYSRCYQLFCQTANRQLFCSSRPDDPRPTTRLVDCLLPRKFYLFTK